VQRERGGGDFAGVAHLGVEQRGLAPAVQGRLAGGMQPRALLWQHGLGQCANALHLHRQRIQRQLALGHEARLIPGAGLARLCRRAVGGKPRQGLQDGGQVWLGRWHGRPCTGLQCAAILRDQPARSLQKNGISAMHNKHRQLYF